MSVTFKDVAKLAGVSTQTVSRVTNGSDSVSENTRLKVNAAIKQLGYIPNKGAQMLSRAKSTNIGLITLDMALHGAAMIANGIRMKAHELNLGVSLSVVSKPTISNIKQAMRELVAQQVDYIIINAPLTKQDAMTLVDIFPNHQLIFIDVPDDTPVHFVHAEHAKGASAAALHLIENQRNNFILITGPEESSASQIRLDSWHKTIKKAGKEIGFQYQGDWQAQSGYIAIKEAIGQQINFDAILVANDQMALGVLRALAEMNIPVPQQVAVVGFDGTADSAYFNPPLTTIKQDFTEIGKLAVLQIINLTQIETIDNIQLLQSFVPVELIKRQSSQFEKQERYQKKEIQQLLHKIESLLPTF